mmetsp:Transcript_8709/g.31377  ORF Transcript_8709/g.31377 Transcript_8709/m.31377 type:complete len:259 (+) Transcript_8709:4911-5687(+)
MTASCGGWSGHGLHLWPLHALPRGGEGRNVVRRRHPQRLLCQQLAQQRRELEGAATSPSEEGNFLVRRQPVQHKVLVPSAGIGRGVHVDALPDAHPVLANKVINQLDDLVVGAPHVVGHVPHPELWVVGAKVNPDLDHALVALAGESVVQAAIPQVGDLLTEAEPLGVLVLQLRVHPVVTPVHRPELQVELGVEVAQDRVRPRTRGEDDLVGPEELAIRAGDPNIPGRWDPQVQHRGVGEQVVPRGVLGEVHHRPAGE